MKIRSATEDDLDSMIEVDKKLTEITVLKENTLPKNWNLSQKEFWLLKTKER